MAIPPKFVGQKLSTAATQQQQHTLELYLDYVCPFSAKLFNTFYASVRPMIAQKYAPKLQVIFRQQIQPWHPSSTLVHEAAAAVLRIAPEKFWQFSADLFRTYERLAKIAGGVGVNERKVLELLTVKEEAEIGQLNVGNEVTNDIKLMVRLNRVVGVHVTPTVYFNVWYPV
jgi:protein-disulfide isomerase